LAILSLVSLGNADEAFDRRMEGSAMVMLNQPLAIQYQPISLLETTEEQMEGLLTSFEPISLTEMDSVSLLNRVDTKYVLSVSQLLTALQQLTEHYRVLEIEGNRLSRYRTLYFDTPDFELYRQHHNGFGSRYKVRTRSYVDSNLSFFEIKHKTNRGRTIKSRFQTPGIEMELDEEANEFVELRTPLHADRLEPKLWNDFRRMTFVSTRCQERLTIDVKIAFDLGGASMELPGIAISEVKQAHCSQDSDFIQRMRELGIRSTPFSKYCMGASLAYTHLKRNNFKGHRRLLAKIAQGESAHDFVH
jgi:hypothetical protein